MSRMTKPIKFLFLCILILTGMASSCSLIYNNSDSISVSYETAYSAGYETLSLPESVTVVLASGSTKVALSKQTLSTPSGSVTFSDVVYGPYTLIAYGTKGNVSVSYGEASVTTSKEAGSDVHIVMKEILDSSDEISTTAKITFPLSWDESVKVDTITMKTSASNAKAIESNIIGTYKVSEDASSIVITEELPASSSLSVSFEFSLSGNTVGVLDNITFSVVGGLDKTLSDNRLSNIALPQGKNVEGLSLSFDTDKATTKVSFQIPSFAYEYITLEFGTPNRYKEYTYYAKDLGSNTTFTRSFTGAEEKQTYQVSSVVHYNDGTKSLRKSVSAVYYTHLSSLALSYKQDAYANLKPEGTLALTPSPTPAGATDYGYTYSSSDESVATVSKEGIVTIKNLGSAMISCVAGNDNKLATLDFAIQLDVPSLTAEKKDGKINLSWTNTGFADSYTLEKKGSTGKDWEKLATLTETTYTDDDFTQGNTYSYRVKGTYLTKYESAYSDVASVTFPPTSDSTITVTDPTSPSSPIFTFTGMPTNLSAGDSTLVSVEAITGVSSYNWYVNGYLVQSDSSTSYILSSDNTYLSGTNEKQYLMLAITMTEGEKFSVTLPFSYQD